MFDFEDLPMAAAGVVKQHGPVRDHNGRGKVVQAARNTTPYRLRLDPVPTLNGTGLDPIYVDGGVPHCNVAQRHIVARILGSLHPPEYGAPGQRRLQRQRPPFGQGVVKQPQSFLAGGEVHRARLGRVDPPGNAVRVDLNVNRISATRA